MPAALPAESFIVRRLPALGASLAALLLTLGCGSNPEAASDSGESLDFTPLPTVHPRLAEEHFFTARDGARLSVRSYGDEAPVDLILLHGSGAYNVYLSELAAEIAAQGAAVVHTPDLRGHGPSPVRRGDIDYIDQLEDDLADLMATLQGAHPERKRVVGGHSSGGGLAIRFAGGPHAEAVDGFLLLAPYLGHDAPTTRPDSGGWAQPKLGRIILLTILNGMGITGLNGITAIEFDQPEANRTGSETSAYTFRMMAGINPRGDRVDLGALCAPTLVLVGSHDEAFVAEAFSEVFSQRAPHARVALVPDASHLGLVSSAETASLSIEWLRTLAVEELVSRCR